MKKRFKTIIITICLLVIIPVISYNILHSTPNLAIRTVIFVKGHPIIAFTTDIVDDELHNKIDKKELGDKHAKCYTITKFLTSTKPVQSNSGNFIVTKKGYLFFADFNGQA